MWYLKVRWHHSFPDEPIDFYSEVGADGYEVRKVVIFQDGRYHWSDETTPLEHTWLAEAPVGSIDEIAEQQEFSPEIIDKHEFERVWRKAGAADMGNGTVDSQ